MKRKTIPISVKTKVWDTYIGLDIGRTTCIRTIVSNGMWARECTRFMRFIRAHSMLAMLSLIQKEVFQLWTLITAMIP